MKFLYTPFYCEENIWHLCQQEEFTHREPQVVFVSNRKRACALWHQRAAKRNQPVYWDYHVILIIRQLAPAGQSECDCWEVWDLDTLLDCPTTLPSYMARTFEHRSVPTVYRPAFRVIPADAFTQAFSSDRSHMKDEDGEWLQPPPSWPPVFDGKKSNLMDIVDLQNEHIGVVLNLDQFKEKFGTKLAL